LKKPAISYDFRLATNRHLRYATPTLLRGRLSSVAGLAESVAAPGEATWEPIFLQGGRGKGGVAQILSLRVTAANRKWFLNCQKERIADDVDER
jgi:hypothetical protein